MAYALGWLTLVRLRFLRQRNELNLVASPPPPPPPQQLLARLGITPDLPADEAAYAPASPRTTQATTSFQNLRAPLTVLLGLGQRVSVGDDKGFHGDLDAMVQAGMEGLSAANPFALAWSQALPNIVNMVGWGGGVVAAAVSWDRSRDDPGSCDELVACREHHWVD